MKPEELTVAFVEDGKEKVREIDKRVLATSSSWATVAYLFSEIDAESGEPKPPKLGLRRYKKRGGRYVLDKHFVLSSPTQARELAEAITRWFPSSGVGDQPNAEIDDDE